jgi:hypothetical protein
MHVPPDAAKGACLPEIGVNARYNQRESRGKRPQPRAGAAAFAGVPYNRISMNVTARIAR